MATTDITGLATPGDSSASISIGGAGESESMDDVLGLSGDAGAGASVDDATFEVPEIEIPEEVQPTETTDQAKPEELDVTTTPNWVKNALKIEQDPKVKAQIQQTWNQLQGFRAHFQTPAQARQFAEKVQQVGGLQKLDEIVSESYAATQQDADFFSGDPEKQEPIIVTWMQKDPNAVYSAFQTTGDLLKSNFPEEWNSYRGQVVNDALKELSDGEFEPFMENMKAAIATGNAEKIALFAVEFANFWARSSKKLGFGQKPLNTDDNPALKAIERQKNELSSNEKTFYDGKFKDFQSGFVSDMTSKVDSLSKGIVDRALEKAKIPEGLKVRISSNLTDEIRKAVTSDASVRNQILQVIDPSGRRQNRFYSMTPETRQQVVNALYNRARQVAPSIAKRVIGEWTKDIVGARKTAIADRQRSAQRPDISAGTPSNWSKGEALTDKEISEKKMSMDDILEDNRPYRRK